MRRYSEQVRRRGTLLEAPKVSTHVVDVAEFRQDANAVWEGLRRSATEGLAAGVVVGTRLEFVRSVLPWVQCASEDARFAVCTVVVKDLGTGPCGKDEWEPVGSCLPSYLHRVRRLRP